NDEIRGVRDVATYALTRLSTPAIPDFLRILSQLLRDPQESVRCAAVRVVWDLGEAAATPEILTALPLLLGDADQIRRSEAAIAVKRIGDSAATPEILAALV